jgi:small GTP-binding protein
MSNAPQDRKPFTEFVGRWQGELRRVWDSLPEETRQELYDLLKDLPIDPSDWRSLVGRAMEHIDVAIAGKQKVAIVGPANAGKSTLYNQFVRKSTDKARVSAVPGTTRQAQQADAGIFSVIDTPGADAVGAVGQKEKELALGAAQQADVLVVVFDATHGVRPPEQKLFGELVALDKPTVAVLNKIDVIPAGERSQVIGKAAAALGVVGDQLIATSALNGEGLHRIILAVAKIEPGIVVALAEALPEYRWQLAGVTIARAASTAAAIAVTPLPFLDFIPLVAVQSTMVLGIARIYSFKITPARARELIATFGVAVLGRTLFHELAKLGGPPGWLVAAAVAAGTTVAIGYGSAVWFENGEKLSTDAMRQISRQISQAVIQRLKDLGRRRPQRTTLRERVQEALGELPPSEPSE